MRKYFLILLAGSLASASVAIAKDVNSVKHENNAKVIKQHFNSKYKLSYQEAISALTVNNRDTKQNAYVLTDPGGNLWLDADNVKRLGLKTGRLKILNYSGRAFYRVSTIRGVKYHISIENERLYLTIPPKYFNVETLNFQSQNGKLAIQSSPLGSFFNYDFFAQKDDKDKQFVNGNFELGIFNKVGVITNDFLVRNIGGNLSKPVAMTTVNNLDQKINGQPNRLIRLNTTLTIDRPSVMRSWHIGDAVSVPGIWGSAVSFGGIQWGTNFGTRPDFVKLPLPAVSGVAAMPSTIDVYINNLLNRSSSVQSGPFDIRNIPIVTGRGNVRLVVTDLLGRQRVITVPFYANSEVLKKGLSDYSVEMGFVRNSYGLRSNDYGSYLVSGTETYGITNQLTGQIHTEMSGETQALGMGTNLLIGNFGMLTTAVAGSRRENLTGGLGLIEFQGQAGWLYYGIGTTLTTKSFRQIGFANKPLPAMDSQASLGFSLGRSGDFSFSYIIRKNRVDANQQFLSANYSVELPWHFHLNTDALMSFSGKKERAVFLEIAVPLDSRTSATFDTEQQKDSAAQYSFQLQRNLSFGPSVGYNIEASTGRDQNFLGGLSAQSKVGSYSGQVASYNGNMDYQLETSGGIVFLNKDIFFTRKINQSFAVANIHDLENIPVYWENHLVNKTNRHGNVLVSNLTPYTKNKLSIKPNELPLNTTISSDKMEVVPSYRSGILVKFPIKRNLMATVTVKKSDGRVLPVGTALNVNKRKNASYIANDGLAFLTNLKRNNHMVAHWWGHSCSFDLRYYETKDPQPDFGTVICKRTKK